MKSQESQTTENNVSSDNAPDIRLIIGLTLVIGAFLFVAAIYYGIVNP